MTTNSTLRRRATSPDSGRTASFDEPRHGRRRPTPPPEKKTKNEIGETICDACRCGAAVLTGAAPAGAQPVPP